MSKHLLSAEHIVSALWYDLANFPIVAGILDPNDMPDTEAGIVYRIMAEQGKQHIPVQGLVETEALRRGVTKDFLVRLNFRGRRETPEALETYAHEIKDHAERFKLANLGAWLLEKAQGEDADSTALKTEILSRITSNQTGSQELRELSFFVTEAQADFADWMDGKISGRHCGFRTLDETLRLVNSELLVIAGRPGSGKTSLGWQVVTHVANDLVDDLDQGRVAVFSADMSGKALVQRAACSLAGVDSRKARRNQITRDEAIRIKEQLDYLRSLPIVMDDSSSPSTENMSYRLMAMNAKHPIRGMMFDFMELGGDTAKSEELRVSGIAKQLRNIAKRMKIPVIALSQLGRDVEDRPDKIPTMSDLRYSGMIESVADNILLITRPEYYIKRGLTAKLIDETDASGIAYVIHAKGRNDGTGFYKLGFSETLSKFYDLPTSYSAKVDSAKLVSGSKRKG